jgi:DNA-binding GntR family transcriptional regulator
LVVLTGRTVAGFDPVKQIGFRESARVRLWYLAQEVEVIRHQEMVEEVRREHREILRAIEDRNPDLASRLAEQHVLSARSRMRSAFASHVVPDIG